MNGHEYKKRQTFMLNRRDNNIVNIFSDIFKVSEAIFYHQHENAFWNVQNIRKNVYDIIISIYHAIKAEKQLQWIDWLFGAGCCCCRMASLIWLVRCWDTRMGVGGGTARAGEGGTRPRAGEGGTTLLLAMTPIN